MTIEESRPNERIRIKLDFLKPFAATNTAEFTFKPQGEGTEITWSMHGDNNFMAKAIGLFMDMDKMIGGNFEQGLADIKSIAETAA
jgi:carbon monoxide dehydrogenase subunit G